MQEEQKASKAKQLPAAELVSLLPTMHMMFLHNLAAPKLQLYNTHVIGLNDSCRASAVQISSVPSVLSALSSQDSNAAQSSMHPVRRTSHRRPAQQHKT